MSADVVPEELKPFSHRFLMRAKMMDGIAQKNGDRGAAKVAYYCRLKAVKSAMANQSSFDISKPDISAFLGDLLTEVEGARTSLGISAETEAADKVSNCHSPRRSTGAHGGRFAGRDHQLRPTSVRWGGKGCHGAQRHRVSKCFRAIALEGLTCAARSVTARQFNYAATLFDVLEDFGSLDPKIAEMRKYAKYMAAEIIKAVREGRQPTVPTADHHTASSSSSSSSGGLSLPPPPSASTAPPPLYGGGTSAPLPAPYAPMGYTPPPLYGEGTSAPLPAPYAPMGYTPPPAMGFPPAATALPHLKPPTASPVAAASPAKPVNLTEYEPISGACWSKDVILATKECSTAIGLFRADDIYGAKQHLEKALLFVKKKLDEHEASGGAAKRL
jgi:hypothetical protein